jgi:hypothetical protein
MNSSASRNGWVALALAGILILGLYLADKDRHLYRMGKAVACKDDSVFEGAQAEILEYGLQDVRGLALDSSQRYLYIAEANREVLIYDTLPDPKQADADHPSAGFINSSHDLICRDGECENLDDRDVAIAGTEIFITENGKARIFLRIIDADHHLAGSKLWDPNWADTLSTPSGIAVIQSRVFVSTEMPARLAQGAGSRPTQRGGALYVACENGDCQPDLIGDTLKHPSGVVSRGANGPVYVADDNGNSVRYLIYRKVPGRGWIEDGFLASVPKGGEAVSRFLGLAFSEQKKMIFAAGPGGIYAFDVHSASMGRMIFDEPVSGVAVSDRYRYIYLVVGHMLCRISLDKVKETNKALPGQELIQLTPGQQDPTVAVPSLVTPGGEVPAENKAGNKAESKSLNGRSTGPPADNSNGPNERAGSRPRGSTPSVGDILVENSSATGPPGDNSHGLSAGKSSRPPTSAPSVAISQPKPAGHPRHNGVPRAGPSNPCQCCCSQKEQSR